MPVKTAVNPDDRLAMEALGSTIELDWDSAVEVNGDNIDQSGNESDSSNHLQESAADSGT